MTRAVKFILGTAFCFLLTSCNTGYEIKENEVLYKDWNEGNGYFYNKLAKVDIHSFEVLKHSNYARDNNHAYYKGKIIKGADAETFHSIDDKYAVDRFAAYEEQKKIDNADGSSFELIDGGPYGKDKNDFYYYTNKMNVYDLKSFKIFDERWSVDKSFYYLSSDTIIKRPVADYNSFKLLGGGYAKDRIHVYHLDVIIKEADASSFKVLDKISGKGKDKNNCYDWGNIINCE